LAGSLLLATSQAMQVEALKDLFIRAKVTLGKGNKKKTLVEQALRSPEVMAIVEEEAKAEGQHIDGVKMAGQTSVRRY
jgi:hypothetical protein